MPEESSAPSAKKPYRSFGWKSWSVLGFALLIIFGLTKPSVIRGCGKSAVVVEAVNNARQIGLALFEFENEYGAFPNEETKALVEKKHGTAIPLGGNSSNAMFRQLFAAKTIENEAMFHAKVSGVRRPDNDNSKPRSILEKGEVGFGYIAGLSFDGNPARPIIICPVIPGTDRFDPKPFNRKAVILRMDNSAVTVHIDENGHAISGGVNLLSPENPIWEGKPPDIRYPE